MHGIAIQMQEPAAPDDNCLQPISNETGEQRPYKTETWQSQHLSKPGVKQWHTITTNASNKCAKFHLRLIRCI